SGGGLGIIRAAARQQGHRRHQGERPAQLGPMLLRENLGGAVHRRDPLFGNPVRHPAGMEDFGRQSIDNDYHFQYRTLAFRGGILMISCTTQWKRGPGPYWALLALMLACTSRNIVPSESTEAVAARECDPARDRAAILQMAGNYQVEFN